MNEQATIQESHYTHSTENKFNEISKEIIKGIDELHMDGGNILFDKDDVKNIVDDAKKEYIECIQGQNPNVSGISSGIAE